jgi:hypothetical protein
MDEESDMTWNKLVTLIFVISSIVVLLLLMFLVFMLPILKE